MTNSSDSPPSSSSPTQGGTPSTSISLATTVQDCTNFKLSKTIPEVFIAQQQSVLGSTAMSRSDVLPKGVLSMSYDGLSLLGDITHREASAVLYHMPDVQVWEYGPPRSADNEADKGIIITEEPLVPRYPNYLPAAVYSFLDAVMLGSPISKSGLFIFPNESNTVDSSHPRLEAYIADLGGIVSIRPTSTQVFQVLDEFGAKPSTVMPHSVRASSYVLVTAQDSGYDKSLLKQIGTISGGGSCIFQNSGVRTISFNEKMSLFGDRSVYDGDY